MYLKIMRVKKNMMISPFKVLRTIYADFIYWFFNRFFNTDEKLLEAIAYMDDVNSADTVAKHIANRIEKGNKLNRKSLVDIEVDNFISVMKQKVGSSIRDLENIAMNKSYNTGKIVSSFSSKPDAKLFIKTIKTISKALGYKIDIRIFKIKYNQSYHLVNHTYYPGR